MAKLSQLLMLESMLDTYDNMNIKDAWIIEKQGESVEGLPEKACRVLCYLAYRSPHHRASV